MVESFCECLLQARDLFDFLPNALGQIPGLYVPEGGRVDMVDLRLGLLREEVQGLVGLVGQCLELVGGTLLEFPEGLFASRTGNALQRRSTGSTPSTGREQRPCPLPGSRNPILELGLPQKGGRRDASRMQVPGDELIVELEERRLSQEIGVHRRFTLVGLVKEVRHRNPLLPESPENRLEASSRGRPPPGTASLIGTGTRCFQANSPARP